MSEQAVANEVEPVEPAQPAEVNASPVTAGPAEPKSLAERESVLSDGMLTFEIQHQDGTITKHSADLMVLQFTFEELQESHSLPVRDGKYVATAAFIQECSQRLQAAGVDGCTPTIAYKLWIIANKAMSQLGN